MSRTRPSLLPLISSPLTRSHHLLPSTSLAAPARFLSFYTITTTTTIPNPTHTFHHHRQPFHPPHPTPRPHIHLHPRYRYRQKNYNYNQNHNYSTSPPSSREATPKPYTFEAVRSLLPLPTTSTSNPPPTSTTQNHHRSSSTKTILIDVREPSELALTGRIPGAYSMPLTSNPDAFYLNEGDFFDRFGFAKPQRRRAGGDGDGEGVGVGDGMSVEKEEEEKGKEGVEEVIFYCKAGVRSRAAARMAREWGGVRIGDMTGGWMEWERKGGPVER